MGKAFAAPTQKCVQDHFRIATGFKLRAVGFQFMAQFMVIEDFTIEDHDHIAIGADEGLVTARQKSLHPPLKALFTTAARGKRTSKLIHITTTPRLSPEPRLSLVRVSVVANPVSPKLRSW